MRPYKRTPEHAESQWSETPEMPENNRVAEICEMPVAFGIPPRLSCQAFLRSWMLWKSLRAVF